MKTKKIITQGSLLLIGLICAIFAGPNWHMGTAAWLAPIFLLRYTRNIKTKGFIIFFIMASVANAINHSCFALVDLFILHLLNGITYGIIFSFPYLVDRLLYIKKENFLNTLIFPSLIVLTEYAFNLIFGTWGTLAITQYSIIQFTQMASITGLFGLSFIMVWFGSTINWIIENEYKMQAIKKGAIIYGGVFVLILIYGDARITFQTKPLNSVKVAAISCDINIHEIFSGEYETFTKYTEGVISEIPERLYTKDEQVKKQIEKTVTAANNDAKIIVWNEISLILNKEQVDSLKNKIQEITKQYNVYVVMAYLEENTSPLPKPFNNKSVLVKPNGTIAWEYKKSYPHPQAEEPITNKGDRILPFIDTPYGRIGNVICYDLDFPDYIKQAAQNNVDIMLVPSYDWEEITPFHSIMAGFSVIENGFSLVRANGIGLATIVDNYGKTISQLNTLTSNNKIIYADVSTKAIHTLYAKIGNVLVYLCLIILIYSLGLRLFTKKP